MDVFISWSGERSKYVAQCLHIWLKQVVQMVKPWMSSENILAGARWNAEIVAHLSKTRFGVICVTPENLSAPWLVFEAGALAKTIETTFVCPYLIGLDRIEAQHPLSQFQCKRTNQEDTYALVRTMHKALLANNPEVDLTQAQLEEAFEQWWPRLNEELEAIPAQPTEQEDEKQADVASELLMLTRGIAQSVSEIQARIVPPPGVPPGLLRPEPVFHEWFQPTNFETSQQHLVTAKTGAGKSEAGKLLEILKHAPTLVAEETSATKLIIVCPTCGKSDGTSIWGLAQKLDGNKSHITAVCQHCNNQFGVHVLRSDKTTSDCPPNCPFHPSGL